VAIVCVSSIIVFNLNNSELVLLIGLLLLDVFLFAIAMFDRWRLSTDNDNEFDV
jgi:hypothetical protein